MAKAIADCHNPGSFELYPDNWRAEARAALVAAASVAPVQPSSTVDEAAITEVINQTIEAMPHARRLYPDVYASEVARAVVEAIGGEGE